MTILKPTPRWKAIFGQKDIEVKEESLISNGFFRHKQLLMRHRCFSGEWSPWLVREQLQHKDAAAVLLWDPKQNKIVMVEQCRIGIVGVYPEQSPWLLEIVAGLVEPGEEVQETVIREAQEEAACQITKLIKIGEFYNSPGGFAEKTTLFCGIITAPDKNSLCGMANEHEDIQVHVLPTQDVLAQLESGQLLTSASTVIALQWLANYSRENG